MGSISRNETSMNPKVAQIIHNIAESLQALHGDDQNKWVAKADWELTLKADSYIPMVRNVTVVGSLDESEWKDQVPAVIHLNLGTEDDWTYWPEFTIHAQVAIGELEPETIAYKMQSNVAFMPNDAMDEKKAAQAAREINRLVESHLSEVYQDYIEKNEEVIKFYKQGGSGQK
jgi:hypothetical protein